MAKTNKNSKLGSLIIAAALLILGITFIIFKDSLKVLGVAVGIIVTLYGAFLGVSAVASKKRGFDFALKIAIGALLVIAGVTVAILNERAIGIFVTVVSLLLIVDASFKLNGAVMCKRFSVNAWWALVIPSLLVIAGAFFIIKYPPSAANVVSIIFGITLIVSAIGGILSIPFGAALERKREAEIYYNVYRKDMESTKK